MADPIVERKVTAGDRAAMDAKARTLLDMGPLRVRSCIFGESGITMPRWGTQTSLSELSAAKRAELEQHRRESGNGRPGHQETLTLDLDARMGVLLVSFLDWDGDRQVRHITVVPLSHVRQMTLE